MKHLLERSIEIILRHQSPSGAYQASLNFKNYRYCWFRDGSYTAYAMDRAGEHGSAALFHHWVAGVVEARRDTVQRAVEKARRNEYPGPDILHTRYDLNGNEAEEEWTNFQLDGFGTWLWALGEHQRMTGARLRDEWICAAGLVAEYLNALWLFPCYDCWEESPGHIHTYTVASIHAGLRAHELFCSTRHTALPAMKGFLLSMTVREGRFVKYAGSDTVDASLVALSTPYRVVEPGDRRMASTVRRIERELRREGGGVHRYSGDTYYGGGEWILLTAWLGWYYTEAGQREKAEELKEWIERQADAEGNLPEQAPRTLNDPASYPRWRERWGKIASPLLWSHAKYIILSLALSP